MDTLKILSIGLPIGRAVMRIIKTLVFAILLACCVLAQDTNVVQVTGDVKQTLTLSADDLAKMPRATARTTNNGMETVYEGVWLHDVLKKAGVPEGSELRGKALTTYVLVSAQDGYQVVFSLGELDPAFVDSEILLADTANGKALFGAQGRFRLIAAKDKPGARSVRMLSRIEVVQLRK
jgi:DMSO/TMAO reductase YedYZ molybdopterin-dependent catalytic subunit